MIDSVAPEVLAKLETLPATPGCYVFYAARRDEDRRQDSALGEPARVILYVGKAKSLRSRVRSYFQENSGDNRYFVPFLQKVVIDLETFVTATEKEAAVLENALIKQHQPRFNVKLRDDKEFLSIRIDPKGHYPRLDLVRKPKKDGARYYGPFHSATSARRSLHLVNKHFQLRTCTDQEMASRQRPCLQHQIKRCPAPCVYEVDRVFYGQQVRDVGLFLEGRHDELSAELERRMKDAAESLEFELAGSYRDQLRAVVSARESQRVVQTNVAASLWQEVLGIYREGDRAELVVLTVRGGRIADTLQYSMVSPEGLATEELVGAFLRERFLEFLETSPESLHGAAPVPDEILLPELPEAAIGIEELLTEASGHKVVLLAPKRKPKLDLVRLANENAQHAFGEKRRDALAVEERLVELQKRLRLPSLPRRIECCDVSHLGGNDTVASIVSFYDNEPDKKNYRSYHIKTVSGGDDYGAMFEVLSRRFRRILLSSAKSRVFRSKESQALDEGSAKPESEVLPAGGSQSRSWEVPDLLVVDGGRNQLNVALAAAADLGLHDLAIVALAKEKAVATPDHLPNQKPSRRKGKVEGSGGVVDRVVLPLEKEPILLRSHSASLMVLARARDEAHRFANNIRQKLAQSRLQLAKREGLSVPLVKRLASVFGSVQAAAVASDEALKPFRLKAKQLAALRAIDGEAPNLSVAEQADSTLVGDEETTTT